MSRMLSVCGRHPYRTAFSVVFALIALVLCVRGIVFETVDDYNIMMTLAGEKTGQPYFQLTFYNVVLAFLIHLLYLVYDGVQWYSLVQLAMLWASCSVILGCVIARLEGKRSLAPVVLLAMTLYFVVFLFYPVQRMQFTTTATLLGCAGVALLFTVDLGHSSRESARSALVVSCLFVVLALVERQPAGLCAGLFWLVALARIFLRPLVAGRTAGLRRFALLATKGLVVSLVAYGCIYLCSTTVRALGDNSDYMSYNEVRIDYQDHPHPTFDEAPELYESVGWDAPLYELIGIYVFADDRFNEDALGVLVEAPETKEAYPDFSESVGMLVSLVRDDATAKGMTVALAGLAVFSLCLCASSLRGIRRGPAVAFAGVLATMLLCLGLLLYLCATGRFMLRLFHTVAIPCSVCLLFFALDALEHRSLPSRALGPQGAGKHSRAAAVASPAPSVLSCTASSGLVGCALLFVALGVGSYLCWGNIWNLQERDEMSVKMLSEVERFAIDHPDEMFVHDFTIANTYNSYDPFRTYDRKPTNLMIAGGSYTYTGAYGRQLEANGLDKLDGSSFIDDGVCFVTDPAHGANQNRVLRYLESLDGDVEMEQAYALDSGVGAYRFSSGGLR